MMEEQLLSGFLERLEKAEEALLGVNEDRKIMAALAERIAKLEGDNLALASRLVRAEKWIEDAAKGQFDPELIHKAMGFKAVFQNRVNS